MKIILTIIPTNLLLYICFYPLFLLPYKPKTRIWFSAICWSANKIYLIFVNRESRSLCKRCPNRELFLVSIFLYSDWIRRFTSKSNWTRNNFVSGQFTRWLYFKAIPNSIYFYKGILLHVIPVRIIVPCCQR